MDLNPDILRAAYAYLRTTKPFRRWNLPSPNRVSFRVIALKDCFGQYGGTKFGHTIDVSMAKVSHTDTLLKTMAHEMAHMRTYLASGSVTHGAAFEKARQQICREHGWDPKEL